MDLVAVLAFAVITSKFLMDNIIKMLCNADNSVCRKANYRGKAIPAIGGIVFIPILLIAVLLLLFLKRGNPYEYLYYLLLVLCMGFVGVIDDLMGDNRSKGLLRHFRSTLRGSMTTGFIKALVGFLASCIISLGSSSTLCQYIVNVCIIALFANTINLFDLRPGRALKVYFAFSLILFSFSLGRLDMVVPFLVLGLSAGLFIPYDLKEICMLGDTGANILGITLGYYSTILMGFAQKRVLLVLLVFVNVITERISITDLIEHNRLLSYIDSLGRRQTGNR